MLKVPVNIQQSPIHGLGIFTPFVIFKDTEIYRFVPQKKAKTPIACDFKIPLDATDDEEKHFGYICPRTPDMLSICGDEARYWNFPIFGTSPNCVPKSFDAIGEDIIIATRDIEAGEELLIDMATDLDAARKLNLAPATL